MLLAELAYLIFVAVRDNDGSNNTWNTVYTYFYVIFILGMTLSTLFSVLHIHKNSKSIEVLGIKTNSTLMKLYVIFWTTLSLVVLINLLLYFMAKRRLENGYMSEVTFAKLEIVQTSILSFEYMICPGLDLLVIFAYFRLGKKLSARAARIVASNLRRASIMPDQTQRAVIKSSSNSTCDSMRANKYESARTSRQIREVLDSVMTLKIVDEETLQSQCDS